jgi:hypothetical protein
VQQFDFKIDDSKMPKKDESKQTTQEVDDMSKMPASNSEQVIKKSFNFFDDESYTY